jgi:uncharacterized membrane protein
MVKRGVGGNILKKSGDFKGNNSKALIHKHPKHPVFRQKLTIGQRVADMIASFGGSWAFISIFFCFLIGWMILNAVILVKGYDPYPFILLNLVLSCLAAVQAPIILMAQNRQAERDRIHAKYDYQVNRKAEREIQNMQKDLDELKEMLFKHHNYVKHGKK